MCRDAGIPLAFQLLGVPVCELSTVFSPSGTLLPSCPYPSYTENYYTQPLPVERMEWFHRQFLGEERRGEWWTEDDWRVSPMQAKNWKGLAKALVITAEMDPLRGEGEEYARWLKEAGNEVEVHRIKGAPHIVMQLDGILEGGKEYNRIVIEALRGTLKK
jgi:acetyl esterase/lipase